MTDEVKPAPGVNIYITHCLHGLDLRLHPRCYLCRPLVDDEPAPPPGGYWVVRPYVPTYIPSTGGTTSAPWCATCQGFHIPGAGPCTGTYS